MERILVAKLDNGMDSCLRVLSVLRNRRVPINEFNLADNDLTLKIDENNYKDVRLFLSKLADIKIQ
ncbi:hypothetical protein [Miniphocaeibacter halophilus]|uniref:Uncharacterized protein n=1 Tax=Miniphocaeibacter halophilus TaxID=2931922 RepID=A0AC61MTX8_9FIRM|nr:hypothetical protein [Miniphocaeibacter halophilus]QQK08085.1 hypothetical protein JFY71_00685 [Miniphocaeibacter halophilus]